MTINYYKEKGKCVLCGEDEGEYCKACYQKLKAEYLILQNEQKNTLRSIEYNKERV